MHFAIIAAGEGSRLREEGVVQHKPLVPIGGVPMIDRLLGIMAKCGAESISVICNREMPEVREHLEAYIRLHTAFPIRLVVESTPSSMHSLARLSEVIPEGKVCVTTVDTIFRERDFAAYVSAFSQMEGGLFAVTPFVDDEKPLWVETESDVIKGFHDAESGLPTGCPRLVSGGIYGLDTRSAWPVLRQCLAAGQSRMRNFQRALIEAGIELRPYLFGKIMDIDHADDIAKAAVWLSSTRLLAIRRAPEFSPNNVEKDAAILQSVVDRFSAAGYEVRTVEEEEFDSMPAEECQQYGRIFHMSRRMATLHKLSLLNAKIVNRPQSVINVSKSREMTFTLLQQAEVPLPQWWAYDPEEDEMFQCDPELQKLLPGWVKAMRSDGVRAGDVYLVQTPLQADSRVITLAEQRVPDIVLTHHLEGDLLKVYVVMPAEGSSQEMYLNTFYPQEQGYSKFGTSELHNTPLARTFYDASVLQQIARRIGQALKLGVFGFDAIIRPDGGIVVIDVNDWPSFSVCREEAAEAIFERYD